MTVHVLDYGRSTQLIRNRFSSVPSLSSSSSTHFHNRGKGERLHSPNTVDEETKDTARPASLRLPTTHEPTTPAKDEAGLGTRT